MSEIKTPLELSNRIKERSANMFDIRRIAKALEDVVDDTEADTLRAIVRAFSDSLNKLAGDNSDNYWDVCKLIDMLEKSVLEETADVEEDLPFVTPDEEVEA